MLSPWGLSLLVSLAAAAVAVVWLAAPDTYPYGSADNVRTGINHLIERGPAVVMMLTFAVFGILLAVVALRADAAGAGLRVAGVGAVVVAAFFAFVMADGAVMSALGYAVALAAPAGIAAVVVLACRKWSPVGLVLAVLLLGLGAVGFATGALGVAGEAATTYLGSFLRDPEGYYPRIAWAFGMAAAAAFWAWVAVGSLLRAPSHGRLAEAEPPSWATPESARRWGRVVTIAAALCPAPYGLIRLTWLTPWPLGGPGVDEFVISHSLDAASRLRGFLFAPACAVGVILTLGLISRWGEVFPRWVPLLSGRAVPVMLAVVPGAAVAAIITISAPGFLLGPIESGDMREIAYMFFFLPLPVWGPLLGAAVFAYWLRRTGGLDAAAATLAGPGPADG